MRVEIRADSVIIDGYVNAVGRDSRAMTDKETGERYVEQIVPGTFMRALMANSDVDIYLDHDPNRKLGDTSSNLTLMEDAIGLKAHAEITDPEVIQAARDERLRGWSFGFYPLNATDEYTSNGTLRRFIDDMELVEVSLIDERMVPAYAGTSIEVRADGKKMEYSTPLNIRADYITTDEPDEDPEDKPDEEPEETSGMVETPEETRSTPVDADRYWQIIADLEVKS